MGASEGTSPNSSRSEFCPIPVDGNFQSVTLAQGEGARASRKLIQEVVFKALGGVLQRTVISDAGEFESTQNRFCFSTDSYTVSPLFFPGGDIGCMSVYGTVNDLAVAGSIPRWISTSFILEEGLPLHVLQTVLSSMARAATACGVSIVAGDTKVVGKGSVDRLFINTSGVGERLESWLPGVSRIRVGDKVVVSGDIGRHGMSMLCARGVLRSETPIESDCRSLFPVMTCLRSYEREVGREIVRTARDATRGGVSAVLHEWAEEARLTINLEEKSLPVSAAVRGACELLGFDPLYVANEGTAVFIVASDGAEELVSRLRREAGCENAAAIGEVGKWTDCPVTIRRIFGRVLPLDEPNGALLPRIC